MEEFFYTIDQNYEAELRIKNSKFLSYAWPVRNEPEVNEKLAFIKELHPKATHHCYAYRLGFDKTKFRSNDDGEPSGTAGKPILGQIDKKLLTNTLLVVVRYYGGIKLGSSGLISAYKESAELVLHSAEVVKIYHMENWELEFGFPDMGVILNEIKSLDIEILNKEFSEVVKVLIQMKKQDSPRLMTKLKARLLSITEDEITEKTTIPHCKITKWDKAFLFN